MDVILHFLLLQTPACLKLFCNENRPNEKLTHFKTGSKLATLLALQHVYLQNYYIKVAIAVCRADSDSSFAKSGAKLFICSGKKFTAFYFKRALSSDHIKQIWALLLLIKKRNSKKKKTLLCVTYITNSDMSQFIVCLVAPENANNGHTNLTLWFTSSTYVL